MILRLQAAHVEKVAARLEAQLVENRDGSYLANIGAVGNEGAFLAVTLPIVILNRAGVGNHGGWAERGKPFGSQIPGFRQAVPFLALALDSIHVEYYRNSQPARPQGEDGVGAIAVQGYVLPVSQQMER